MHFRTTRQTSHGRSHISLDMIFEHTPHRMALFGTRPTGASLKAELSKAPRCLLSGYESLRLLAVQQPDDGNCPRPLESDSMMDQPVDHSLGNGLVSKDAAQALEHFVRPEWGETTCIRAAACLDRSIDAR